MKKSNKNSKKKDRGKAKKTAKKKVLRKSAAKKKTHLNISEEFDEKKLRKVLSEAEMLTKVAPEKEKIIEEQPIKEKQKPIVEIAKQDDFPTKLELEEFFAKQKEKENLVSLEETKRISSGKTFLEKLEDTPGLDSPIEKEMYIEGSHYARDEEKKRKKGILQKIFGRKTKQERIDLLEEHIQKLEFQLNDSKAELEEMKKNKEIIARAVEKKEKEKMLPVVEKTAIAAKDFFDLRKETGNALIEAKKEEKILFEPKKRWPAPSMKKEFVSEDFFDLNKPVQKEEAKIAKQTESRFNLNKPTFSVNLQGKKMNEKDLDQFFEEGEKFVEEKKLSETQIKKSESIISPSVRQKISFEEELMKARNEIESEMQEQAMTLSSEQEKEMFVEGEHFIEKKEAIDLIKMALKQGYSAEKAVDILLKAGFTQEQTEQVMKEVIKK